MKNEIIKYNNEIEQRKKAAWNSLSENTQQAYQYDFNLFFSIIRKSPSEVNENDILSFITYLEKEGYKPATINRKIAALSKMFSVLAMVGEITDNPVGKLREIKKVDMGVSKEVVVSLTIQDIKKAIKKRKTDTEQDRKISIIIRTLACTGMRISELINMKHSDFCKYFNDSYMFRIIGKGKKERFIYLPANLYNEIEQEWEWQHYMRKFIFYNKNENKYCRKYLWKVIKERFAETTGKNVRPHLLRHFFVTQKISKEKQDIKAVSRYVGHSDISTTLKMYVDTSLNAKDSKIDI